MAKKARKKSKPAKKTKTRAKKSKPASKKKAAKRVTKRKAKRAAKTIGDRLSSGYHIMVDTVTGTEKLRVKMEKPGTDETE